MAVQPAPANVLSLSAAPAAFDLPTQAPDLAQALETERSAGKALLTALGQLERELGTERRRATTLEVELIQAREEVTARDTELKDKRRVTLGLFAQLEEARAALEDERTRPFFQRLFNR